MSTRARLLRPTIIEMPETMSETILSNKTNLLNPTSAVEGNFELLLKFGIVLVVLLSIFPDSEGLILQVIENLKMRINPRNIVDNVETLNNEVSTQTKFLK